jgi:hypothetical protein
MVHGIYIQVLFWNQIVIFSTLDEPKPRGLKFLTTFLIKLFENLKRVGILPLVLLPKYSNVFLLTSTEPLQIRLWCLWIEVKPYKVLAVQASIIFN